MTMHPAAPGASRVLSIATACLCTALTAQSPVPVDPRPIPPAGRWDVVPSPNTGHPIHSLYGVAAIAADDVWAVGARGIFGLHAQQVIQHWDGRSWTLAASPPLASPNELLAVSAAAANDVWAVGGYDRGGQALIQHWNGSTWRVVAHPNPGTFNRFFGVAAVSGRNAWAVGQYHDGGLARTLVQHWDGSAWSVVASPNVATEHNRLNAVTAVPGSPELWAVGTAGRSGLILRWDGTRWSSVPCPSAGLAQDLTGVVALSSNDVWAVGHAATDFGQSTLTVHWNGSTWSVIPSPNPSSTYNHLRGVDAFSLNDVWAVGDFNDLGGHGRTLILRWNGSAWSRVAGDDSGPAGLQLALHAVGAIGGNDVWSVGSNSHTLAEHWDGTRWRIAPTPNTGPGVNILNGVSGSAANDVWAVGRAEFGIEQRTLVEHWNGSAWRVVPSPNTTKRLNELHGVAAISPFDAWAVGAASSGSGPDQTTLILHWDGAGWSVVPSPSPGTSGHNELRAVSASSPNDVWAVGSFTDRGGPIQTLVLHWDGAGWSVIQSANVPGTNNGLFGVVALAPNDVWAVGYTGSFVFSPLVQHWNGSTWSVVPSPDPQVSSNVLRAVSAHRDPRDVASVATSRNLLTSMPGSLAMHWNGTAWNLDLGGGASNGLYGVATTSAYDGWAVGDVDGRILTTRWNGDVWSVHPNPGTAGRLHAVTAISDCDLWAVGLQYIEGLGFQALCVRFTCR